MSMYQKAQARKARFREIKDGLNVAFRTLRKQGILARQNYLCCGGCASVGIHNLARERAKKGKPVKGGVFYHIQNNDCLKGGGDLHISFDMWEESEGTAEMTATEVGQMLQKALVDAGLDVEWNGSSDQCVKVLSQQPGFTQPAPA